MAKTQQYIQDKDLQMTNKHHEDLDKEHLKGKLTDPGEISDGYHTFNELYDYRKVYNALLFNEWASQDLYDVRKSTKHFDGEDCFGGGWFVVMAQTPAGQISNHYEMEDWDLFRVLVQDCANEWDGHTAAEALERMKNLTRRTRA